MRLYPHRPQVSIRPYERVASASAPGLQWVVTATPVHAAEARHILSRLD